MWVGFLSFCDGGAVSSSSPPAPFLAPVRWSTPAVEPC